MSEVQLVVRDRERDIHGTRHGASAERVVAALSAEPETIEELEMAIERFEAPRDWRFFQGFHPGIDDEPYDAGIVVVDLAARLVVCETTYCSAGREGYIEFHDGRCATDVGLRYHLADDWKIISEAIAWQVHAKDRRRERAANPPLDTRAVVYGNPLLEFIGRECFAAFAGRGPEGGEQDAEPAAAIREIHAKWLTTSRDDLRGESPRAVMLARRDFIDWDLQDRAEQWSRMGSCPRGLDPESAAFRLAGFGTHELVIYYDLVRHLLWSSLDAARSLPQPNGPAALMVGDFLTDEVPRLSRLRDDWLDSPDPEFHGRTPRSVIHNERARLPEGVTGKEAVVDHDCPLCQMQADLPGPMFWHLDGCNMDDEFAFSFCRTREEWDEERRSYEEFNRNFAAREAECKRLGVEYPGHGYADPDYVWEESFSSPKSSGNSALIRLFTVGSHLAELITELKEPYRNGELPADERELIDRLSRCFGNLGEVARSDDIAMAAALYEPVLDRFCESLDAVVVERADLESKCSDLQTRLRRFFESPQEVDDLGDGEWADSPDTDGLPF